MKPQSPSAYASTFGHMRLMLPMSQPRAWCFHGMSRTQAGTLMEVLWSAPAGRSRRAR